MINYINLDKNLIVENNNLIITVECYAGYRGEESPRRFFLGQKSIDVIEILDRWLAPDHRYFKVKGSDDGIYIIRHDTNTDQWEMTLFDSGKSDQTRLSTT